MSYLISIDPSLNSLGYCVLKLNKNTSKLPKIETMGSIETKASYTTQQKLLLVSAKMREIMGKYQPIHNNIYIEKGFSRFVKATAAANKVRSVVELELHNYNLIEITPTQVKKEIANDGKADKDEVMKAIADVFKLDLSDFKNDDESDALAIAYLGWKAEFAENE